MIINKALVRLTPIKTMPFTRSFFRGGITAAFIMFTLMIGAAMEASNAADSNDIMEASTDSNVAHAKVLLDDRYPSATKCESCHPVQYRQWSISQHSYAQMSPVFNAMQGSIGFLTNGTLGDFCIRCHTPVGMNLKEKELSPNLVVL